MKRIILAIAGGLVMVALMATPTLAVADVSSGQGATAISNLQILPSCLTDDPQAAPITCVRDTILHFTNLLLWLIAVAAFLYMLYGAFLYTTAFGDESKIKTAKNAIKYALIGIVIATLANVLVDWLKKVLNVTGV